MSPRTPKTTRHLQLVEDSRQLGARANAEFSVHAGEVILDGFGREEEFAGDFAVGGAVGDHFGDFFFLGGEAAGAGGAGA